MTACRSITLVLYVIGLSIFVDPLASSKINQLSDIIMTTPDHRQVFLQKKTFEGLRKWMLPGRIRREGETFKAVAERIVEKLTGTNDRALSHIGTYLFTMGDPTAANANLPLISYVSAYVTEASRGDVRESKNFKWFDVDDLPSDEMFETEKGKHLWLPLAFRRQKFEGYFVYDSDSDHIISYNVEPAD